MTNNDHFTGNEKATTISRTNDITRVVYHHTEVVTIDHMKREVTFRTGGWETATTRRRMNQACNAFDLPFRVYIRDYGLYVSHVDFDNEYGVFPLTLGF